MVYCAVMGCTNNNNKKSKTYSSENSSSCRYFTFPIAKDICNLWGCKSAIKDRILMLKMLEYVRSIFRMMIFVLKKNYYNCPKISGS